ncbi:hypothetical protein INR49_009120 [Caranx melampygus]|nr:hypothetical protein INR49_009120 [Caranx melampygus]
MAVSADEGILALSRLFFSDLGNELGVDASVQTSQSHGSSISPGSMLVGESVQQTTTCCLLQNVIQAEDRLCNNEATSLQCRHPLLLLHTVIISHLCFLTGGDVKRHLTPSGGDDIFGQEISPEYMSQHKLYYPISAVSFRGDSGRAQTVEEDVLRKGFWVSGRERKHLFVHRKRGEDPAEEEQIEEFLPSSSSLSASSRTKSRMLAVDNMPSSMSCLIRPAYKTRDSYNTQCYEPTESAAAQRDGFELDRGGFLKACG